MNPPSTRTVFRWVHLILGIPILGYIYSPFDQLPAFAGKVRHYFVPLLLLSGFWMWKGHLARRLGSQISGHFRPTLPAANNR